MFLQRIEQGRRGKCEQKVQETRGEGKELLNNFKMSTEMGRGQVYIVLLAHPTDELNIILQKEIYMFIQIVKHGDVDIHPEKKNRPQQ